MPKYDPYDPKTIAWANRNFSKDQTRHGFSVGDIVIFINYYGLTFKHVVIGFANDQSKLVASNADCFIDNDCYWCPVPHIMLKGNNP